MAKAGRKRSVGFTPAKRKKFLSTLAASGNVTYSAEAVGVCKQTVYEARDRDPDFATAWESAKEFGVCSLKVEARRRAVEGTLRPVFYEGKKCGHIREYSDSLLMFMLKQADPSYRDRVDVNARVKTGNADIQEMTEEELLEHLASIHALLQADGLDPGLLGRSEQAAEAQGGE